MNQAWPPSRLASERCHDSPLMKESYVCVIVWLCFYVSLFLMCARSLSLFEICARHPESLIMGGWWTECFPSPEWDTFRHSFEVANCIFDTRAHPNDKHLLLKNSLWYLTGRHAATARQLVSSQGRELDWYHFVLSVKNIVSESGLDRIDGHMRPQNLYYPETTCLWE